MAGLEHGVGGVGHGVGGIERGAWGVGRGVCFMGHGAWGMGHGARGIGYGAWGMPQSLPWSLVPTRTNPNPNPDTNPNPSLIHGRDLRMHSSKQNLVNGLTGAAETTKVGPIRDKHVLIMVGL